MTLMSCYGNQLTSLSVEGCTALKTLLCYQNKISGTGMTTLVNSLPTRSASDPGFFRVLGDANENNVITANQMDVARSKFWNPQMWNGNAWVDITASTRGDVDGDGNVGVADVTALVDYIFSGDDTDVNLEAADCDGNNTISIADVTALVDYLLSSTWN